MKFDEALDGIGGFGKYQKIQFFLACVPAVVIALHQLASVFIAATPEYRCAHNSEDETFDFNVSALHYNRSAIQDYSGCLDYSGSVGNDIIAEKCERFVYSREYFTRTIVTDWDLLCGDKFKSTLSTMVYMGGKLVGNFLFGLLSDIFGRKKTLLLAVLLLTAFGLGAAFSPNYYVFVVLRMGVGACASGLYMCLFIISMELIGKEYRLMTGVVICLFFSLGYVLLSGIAFLSRNWMNTQMIITFPMLLFLSYYWLVPESARWLLSKNRVAEANEIVQKAAKVNKVKLPKDFTLEYDEPPKAKFSEMIRKAGTLCTRFVIICLNWFAVSMGYYGLSLNSGNIGGNIYINFMLSGAVEFLAYGVCFSINKLGRKGPHIFGMLVGGVACIATVLVDHFVKGVPEEKMNVYFVSLNVVGKFGMTVAFCVIYLWSAEMYPTSLRTSLMGLSAMAGRVGQILSPLITDIGNFVPKKYSRLLPAVIFGVSVILSGLLTFLLPETADRELP
ncbi:Orct [Bugula neritina]|uniref:Orct n=1 Tax=Bugula neritina TaxID=10212 RepID=A0A7J7KBR0_BUGNE|nr:Orct [Bugula neritina]